MPLPTPIPPEILEQVRSDLFNGRRIAAIKRCRAATGEGLKESKEIITALEKELRAKEPSSFTAGPSTGGCMGVLVFGLMGASGLGWLAAHL